MIYFNSQLEVHHSWYAAAKGEYQTKFLAHKLPHAALHVVGDDKSSNTCRCKGVRHRLYRSNLLRAILPSQAVEGRWKPWYLYRKLGAGLEGAYVISGVLVTLGGAGLCMAGIVGITLHPWGLGNFGLIAAGLLFLGYLKWGAGGIARRQAAESLLRVLPMQGCCPACAFRLSAPIADDGHYFALCTECGGYWRVHDDAALIT